MRDACPPAKCPPQRYSVKPGRQGERVAAPELDLRSTGACTHARIGLVQQDGHAAQRRAPVDHRGVEVGVRDRDDVDAAARLERRDGLGRRRCSEALPQHVGAGAAHVQRALVDGELGAEAEREDAGVVLELQRGGPTRASACVVQAWPAQPTYWRSSSQTGQAAGGRGVSANWVPQVVQMKWDMAVPRGKYDWKIAANPMSNQAAVAASAASLSLAPSCGSDGSRDAFPLKHRDFRRSHKYTSQTGSSRLKPLPRSMRFRAFWRIALVRFHDDALVADARGPAISRRMSATTCPDQLRIADVLTRDVEPETLAAKAPAVGEFDLEIELHAMLHVSHGSFPSR